MFFFSFSISIVLSLRLLHLLLRLPVNIVGLFPYSSVIIFVVSFFLHDVSSNGLMKLTGSILVKQGPYVFHLP